MKRVLFLMLAMLLTVSVLMMSACDNGGTSETSSENQSTASESKEPVTLSFIGMTGNYADSVSTLAERLGEDLNIEMEMYDVPYVNLHENIMLDLSSGAGSYDLVMTNASWFEESAQHFVELQPYVDASGMDLTALSSSTVDACKIGDTLYAFPVGPTPNMMAYRTDLVDTPPTTWEEYLEIAEQFTNPDEGMFGISLPGAKSQAAVLFLVRLWSMGQDVADEDWNVVVDSDIGKAAMQNLKDSMQFADPACLTWGLNEAHNAFLQGNAVFCEAWPTLGIAQKADDPELSVISGKWAMAPFPEDASGAKQMSLQCFGISNYCDDKQLAFDFLEKYMAEDYQVECFNEYSTLPSALAFYDTEDIKTSPLAALGEGLRGVCLTKWNVFVSAEQDTIMTNAVGSFMAGEKTLEETMDYYATNLEEAIANNKPSIQNNHAIVIQEAVADRAG